MKKIIFSIIYCYFLSSSSLMVDAITTSQVGWVKFYFAHQNNKGYL